MSDYAEIQVDHDGNVTHVQIDTSARFNSLTRDSLDELLGVVTTAAEDDGVRCLTLTGAGEVFCSGANLAAFDGDESDGAVLRQMASELHDVIVQLHQAETPVITGVNGVGAGAGFSLAIMGDVVLVSDEARLEYAYPRIGLTGDGGSTFYLPRLVGLRKAREIVLLDEPISPEEAVDLGLATEVVPADELDDRLAEMGERLAAKPTKAVGATKRLLTESFARSIEEQLSAETEQISLATDTEDYQRGIAAFGSDEDAEFVGR